MMLLWLLVAFIVDSPAFCFNADDEKVTPDSGNHIGQISYFSQISESHPATCKQEGDREGTIETGRSRHCWGYEPGCTTPDKWFTKPQCNDEEHWRRFRSKEEKIYEFWKESDFGYVKSVQDNLQVVCKPKEDQADSLSLVCSKQLTYCKAENLYIDLRDNTPPPNHSSQPDVFKPSKIGGYCEVDNSSLDENGKHRMDLSSWLNQVEGFSSLPFHPIRDRQCDVVVDKPTFFMKLDAVVNMYHHFCDFFNLYATQHVNGSFDTDVNIVLWEKHARRGLGNFGATWEAFTTNRVLYLGHEYNNQRVCFRHAIFALLPRMVYGLYYNTPLIRGCSKSGLFKAFSDHVINRLGVKQEKNLKNSSEPIRITLLSRGTKFRKILNEEEDRCKQRLLPLFVFIEGKDLPIIHALSTYPGVELNVSTYSWDMPFIEQVKRSHNSDIFIGMHGAGLTHTLFLPDWALLFELYNCDDPNCYRDLARLRGVSYMTWENKDKVVEHTEELHPKYSDHSKFRNYAFDVREFMRLVEQAVDTVRQSVKEKSKQEYNG